MRTPVLLSSRVARAALRFAMAMLAGSALLAPASAQAAYLPKGFPYAARVVFEVRGTWVIQYSDTSTTYNVCQTQSATTKTDVSFDGEFERGFDEITVPLVSKKQLGKAYRYLKARPETYVRPIHAIPEEGIYRIEGTGPSTALGDGAPTDCDHKAFDGAGYVTILTTGANVLRYNRDLFEAPILYFHLGDFGGMADPQTFKDSVGADENVAGYFNRALSYIPYPGGVPTPAAPKLTWNALAVALPIRGLSMLLHSDFLELKIRSGGHEGPCSAGTNTSGETGSETCYLSASFSSYKIYIDRVSLVRTTRAYAK